MARKKKPEGDTEDHDLKELLLEAASSVGWFFPESEEEVDESPDRVFQDSEVGAETLPDPYDLLRHGASARRREVAVGIAPETAVEEELARAARAGSGEIPKEVEERMKEDRELAEKSHSDP